VEALRSDVARGGQRNDIEIVPKTRDFTVVVFCFSTIFGLILTHVLKTEWSVAAPGAALRPIAMQIADRSGDFLVCARAPHQAFPSRSICGEMTVY